jgi:hypothetical protein
VKSWRKLITLVLIFSVIISGNGIVLAVHTCFSSSTKSVSIFEKKCSCSKEHEGKCHDEPEVLKAKCCSYQLSYHKLNIPVTLKKVTPDSFCFPVHSISLLKTSFVPEIFTLSDDTHFSLPDIPVAICQLLI